MIATREKERNSERENERKKERANARENKIQIDRTRSRQSGCEQGEVKVPEESK